MSPRRHTGGRRSSLNSPEQSQAHSRSWAGLLSPRSPRKAPPLRDLAAGAASREEKAGSASSAKDTCAAKDAEPRAADPQETCWAAWTLQSPRCLAGRRSARSPPGVAAGLAAQAVCAGFNSSSSNSGTQNTAAELAAVTTKPAASECMLPTAPADDPLTAGVPATPTLDSSSAPGAATAEGPAPPSAAEPATKILGTTKSLASSGLLVWRLPSEAATPTAPDTEPQQQVAAAAPIAGPKQMEACHSVTPQKPVLLSRVSNRAGLDISDLALLREQALQVAASQRRGTDEADPMVGAVRTSPLMREAWRRGKVLNHPNAASESPAARGVQFQLELEDSPRLESSQMRPGSRVSSLARAAALAMKEQQPVTLAPGCEASNRSRDSHVHGTGRTCGVGFVGHGPFWTCNSAPQGGRLGGQANGSPANQRGRAAVAAPNLGSGGHSGAAVAATAPGTTATPSGDLPGRVASVVGHCLELLAKAVDAPADAAPPEDELTAVRLETKEQRLQWRDFLAETVSKRCATNLYASYDVEAEPPGYAKPPLSAQQSSPRLPLTGVAPHGTGWSPLVAGVSSRHNASSSSASPGVLGLLGCSGRPPTPPQRSCTDAISETWTWLPEPDEEPKAGYALRGPPPAG